MVDTIVENYRKWNRRFKDVVKKKKNVYRSVERFQ